MAKAKRAHKPPLQPNPPPTRSASEVFSIPELLEMILAESEMRDVLLWQRVDKTFNSVIANSKTLQEKLYFRPMTMGSQPAIPNALVFKHFAHNLDSKLIGYFQMNIGRDFQTGEHHVYLFFRLLHRDPFARRSDEILGEGSWRRMFLSQPPSPLLTRNFRSMKPEYQRPNAKASDVADRIRHIENKRLADPSRLRSLRSSHHE